MIDCTALLLLSSVYYYKVKLSTEEFLLHTWHIFRNSYCTF